MNWKLWFYGMVAAVIGTAATAATNVFVLPLVLDHLSIKKLFVVTGLNAGLAGAGAFFAYLKTHPVPDWTGVDRRNGQANSAVAGKP